MEIVPDLRFILTGHMERSKMLWPAQTKTRFLQYFSQGSGFQRFARFYPTCWNLNTRIRVFGSISKDQQFMRLTGDIGQHTLSPAFPLSKGASFGQWQRLCVGCDLCCFHHLSPIIHHQKNVPPAQPSP